MSGQDILIEQLRAEVERLRDDRADLQERCNRLTGERNAALLLMKGEEARAEKAEEMLRQARTDRDREAFDRQTAQDAWNDMRRQRDAALVRAETAERFVAHADSEWKARAEKAERERDEALRRRTRAERVGEAVIEWASRQTAELITEYAKALERHDWKPHAELTYAIADALKEADDAE